MAKNEMKYVVRKSWKDVESQAGLDYSFLANAKKACNKLEGYAVFDMNGNQVYPEVEQENVEYISNVNIDIKVGDKVVLTPNATNFVNGDKINSGLINKPLFVSSITNGQYGIGPAPTGAIFGRVTKDVLALAGEEAAIKPYIVQLKKEAILYVAPNSNQAFRKLPKFSMLTIINEKDGFGKVKVGAGWIKLSDADKLA